MKKVFLLGALLLGLTACGGGGGGTVTPTPDTSYPYNPNASATQSSDARTPYRGDWVFVATLADGSTRTGVASITTAYSNSALKMTNAGGGFMAWCYKAGCSPDDEQGTGLIGSVSTSGSVALTVGMVPENATAPRFWMTDTNGQVETLENRALISGQGSWVDAAGKEQLANFQFVQVNTTSALSTQQARAQALLTAQRASQGQTLSVQKAAPLGELRAVLERALAK